MVLYLRYLNVSYKLNLYSRVHSSTWRYCIPQCLVWDCSLLMTISGKGSIVIFPLQGMRHPSKSFLQVLTPSPSPLYLNHPLACVYPFIYPSKSTSLVAVTILQRQPSSPRPPPCDFFPPARSPPIQNPSSTLPDPRIGSSKSSPISIYTLFALYIHCLPLIFCLRAWLYHCLLFLR